jgi:hypothetical protein
MYELLFWKYLDEVYLNHQEVSRSARWTNLTRTTQSSDFNRIGKCFFQWEKVDDSSWKTVMDWRFLNVEQLLKVLNRGMLRYPRKTMDTLVSMFEWIQMSVAMILVPARYDEMYEDD